MKNKQHILIIAGEISGDLHAAKLIQEVHHIAPQWEFFGIGGQNMRAAGAEIFFDCARLAVVGATEIVHHFRDIYNAYKRVRTILQQQPPAMVILVDYPGFNLRIAKIAKQAGCKVFYYISPQLWAWRRGRIKIIQRYVDQMAVILPFEKKFYQQAGIAAAYVGNPLLEHVKTSLSIAEARQRWQVDAARLTVGILPGSRKNELKHVFPLLLRAAELIMQQQPRVQFLLPLAPSLTPDDLAPYLKKHPTLPICVIQGHTYDVLQLCDAAMITSGTATLEAALLGIPMAIVYKMAFFSAFLAAFLVRTPYIGLCNIVAEAMVAQEFIQHRAKPKQIAAEIKRILEDVDYRKQKQAGLNTIRAQLANEPAENLGELVLRTLQSR
ncbi:MAG: lipid-A-disaccharide synthase [Gammaproteobacteria bacterium]